MTQPSFRIVAAGASRSFPEDDGFLKRARDDGEVLVIIGADAGAAYAGRHAATSQLVLIELAQQCLGEITGEHHGTEGGNVLGFSRFRLGSAPPSQLIELVVQPRTPESARSTATALFQDAGFAVAICADRPGRIVDRLLRPYFNAVLERLDEGLATAEDLDRAVKMGLGFRRGPIEWLEETGLEEHCRVSLALSEALQDPWMRPARRARVAAQRTSRR